MNGYRGLKRQLPICRYGHDLDYSIRTSRGLNDLMRLLQNERAFRSQAVAVPTVDPLEKGSFQNIDKFI